MLRADALPDRFRRPRKRGEPLVMFMVVLMIWMGGRSAMWEELSMAVHPGDPGNALAAAPRIMPGKWQNVRRTSLIAGGQPVLLDPPRHDEAAHHWALPTAAALSPMPMAPIHPLPLSVVDPLTGLGRAGVRTAVTQQVLYLAAIAGLPLPVGMEAKPPRRRRLEVGRDGMGNVTSVLAVTHEDEARALVVARQNPQFSGGRQSVAESRWSGDGWLLMRQGGNNHELAGGSAPYGPTYGANQVGAVLRYRLIPGEAHKLTAYARGYGALNGTGEREVAAGLSLRPVPAVPVIAMAEMRASQFQSGRTHVRPAVSLVTEIPPVLLGRQIEAETYVQAGYVGGAASTPFIDGQIRVEQVVAHVERAELRVGLGAWGGAQEGANRLDVGPTLRLGMRQGRVGARLAIDYRLRVRGNAMPSSGPALTLSAGF